MKYYIQSGTLALIYSTSQEPYDACRTVIHEINEYDELDEFMYCCLLYTSPSPRDDT